MPSLVLRVRPKVSVTDVDLDDLRARLARLREWTADVRDTRLSDAPYVTVVAETTRLDEDAAAALRDVLLRVPRADVDLWLGIGTQRPLETCDLATLEAAAAAFEALG